MVSVSIATVIQDQTVRQVAVIKLNFKSSRSCPAIRRRISGCLDPCGKWCPGEDSNFHGLAATGTRSGVTNSATWVLVSVTRETKRGYAIGPSQCQPLLPFLLTPYKPLFISPEVEKTSWAGLT